MIDICCDFAKEYNIMLKPKRTVCIKFGDNVINYEKVIMKW